MITAKFGGTAITPRNLVYLKKNLTPQHKIVVVSAIGKCHPNDIKTTDLLCDYFRTRNPKTWQTVCDRYRQLVDVNCVDIDVDKLLFDAHSRALQFDLDYCTSLGEELSAKIVAKFLHATYVEAQQVVTFGNRSLNTKQTLFRIKNATKDVNLAVIGGFYGGCNNGRKTFSRGGSDVTASLCAAAIGSTLCQNWTDANGVCQGNPTEIFGVKTLTHLSYDQMYQLAQNGATVLHPDALKPLQKVSIPLVVGNFYNPNAPQTTISNAPNTQRLLCVTQKTCNGSFVATVLHNMLTCEIFHRLHVLSKNLQTNVAFRDSVTTPKTTNNLPRDIFCGQKLSSSWNGNLFCIPTATIQKIIVDVNTVTIVTNQNVIQQIFDIFNKDLSHVLLPLKFF